MDDDAERSETLPWWRRIGYGIGDIFGGGSGVLISLYYLVFLVDVARIDPQIASFVLLISKLYDAISDPIEGIIADRTRTPLGRRRPYLLAGVILIIIATFGLFYPVDFEQEAARFVFVLGTYLFFSTVFSLVMLNYNALQSEITLDYNERTLLSSIRIAFSAVGSILAGVLPFEIIEQFADVRVGWMAMAFAFGVLFGLPFIATVIATEERDDFQRPPAEVNWRAAFIEPLQVKSFALLLGMYVCAFAALDAIGSSVVFFMRDYLGRQGEVSTVSGALIVSQLIGLPLYVTLSKRTSKRTAYIVGGVMWIVCMALTLFITPERPDFLIYIIVVLVGIGVSGVVVMVYAIFPDIPDVDELKTGQRREGVYGALFGLFRKFSSAFALFLVAQVIGLAGYMPPEQVTVDGITRLVTQPQTDDFLLTLRLLFAFTPAVFVGVGILFAWRFPLSPEAHARLNTVLRHRRSDAPPTPAIEQEADTLEDLLH